MHSRPCAARVGQSEEPERIEEALFLQQRICPDKACVVDGELSFTYDDVARRAAAMADEIRARRVVPGDRVAIYLDKTVESVVALYGAWAAGAIAVPINEGLRSRQIRHIVEDSQSCVVISSERKIGRLDGVPFDGVDVVNEGALRAARGPSRAAGASRLTGASAPAAILYTSGSTGRPKGILISHANLVAGSRIVSRYLEIDSSDRILSVLPFSFDYGLNQLLDAIRQGATIYLQRSHFAPDICRSLERHGITLLAAVPPLWIQLMAPPSPFGQMAFPHLRTLTNSGGVFPTALVARYRAHLPHARLFLMYGLSEAFRSTYLPPELIDKKPGSMGRAIPETDVRVVAEDGSECAPGQPGELVHRGPTVALGYWQNPEATALRFRADPLAPESGKLVVYSGDVVKKDEDGFFYFVGRRDQMIKTLGYRVSPEEVEEILLASGLVSEVIVRGEANEEAGAVIVAHVVPRLAGHFSPEELLSFCRREMPSYMVPRTIDVRSSLPRTSSGKLDRNGVVPR
jgi:acyl-CoA ligase (AMP-forming) (exosortase A-associated)